MFAVNCNTYTVWLLCTFPTFSHSTGTPPRLFWGVPLPFLVLESCHSQCPRPLPWIDTPPNHSPQASGDTGLSKDWAHASGRPFLYVSICMLREKIVFGGWDCSPGRMYGQTLSHPQEHKYANYIYRGSRAEDAEKQPCHFL